MKNRITVRPAMAAFAFTLLAGTAYAQSSVTIFGVVDNAVRSAHTNNAGHINSLISGGYSSTRYGFRGTEDLGGGLSAGFWLESFLNSDTGVINPAGFQRRSTLSLTQREWGELRVGRDYTPTHSNWARFDPFGYVGLGSVQLFSLAATGNTPATSAFGTNPNPIQRANNGVQYLLPRNAWGVEGGIQTNFREGGTAANDLHKSGGGRLGATVGPVFVSAAYFQTTDSGTTGPFKDSALAAAWTMPWFKLSGGVRHFEYLAAKQNNYLVAAVVPFGVQEIKASWNRLELDGRVGAINVGNDRADQFALGYVYHLSKRTHAYTTVATIRNKGNARFVLPGAPAGVAGVSSKGFELGVNHEF